MGEQLGTTDLWWSGIGVPDPRHSIWTAECSYTPYDRTTAEVVPAQSTSLVLAATGTPTSSTALQFKAQTGGTPGIDGARFVWRESGAAAYQGWVPPTRQTWATHWSIASRSGYRPKPVALPNGSILVVHEDDGGSTEDIRAWVYNPATDTAGSDVIVWRSTEGLGSYSQHPTPVILDDGTVIVFSLRGTTLQAFASMDNGATWSLWSDSILSIDEEDGTVLRMTAAYSNGQILLMTEYEASGSFHPEGQTFASADLGLSFTQVTFDATDMRHKTLTACAGYFVLVYCKSDTGLSYAARTANAFTAPGVGVQLPFAATAEDFTESGDDLVMDYALAVEESGALWVYCMGEPFSPKGGRCTKSIDVGLTWATSTTSTAAWWRDGAVGTYSVPYRFAAVYQRGAVYMATNRSKSGTDRLAILTLGGWQSVTMGSARLETDIPTTQGTWSAFDLLPMTDTGTVTHTLSTGYEQVTCATTSDSSLFSYTDGYGSTGRALRACYTVTTGQVATRLRIGGAGGPNYEVEIVLTAAGALTATDKHDGSSVGSATGITGKTEILVALGPYGSTSGYAAIVWYSQTAGAHKVWTKLGEGPITDGTVGPGAYLRRVQVEVSAAGGVAGSVRIHELHYDDSFYVGGGTFRDFVHTWSALTSYLPIQKPHGRSLPGTRSAYAGNGVSLRGTGRATPGHTWTMTPGETYGPDRCLPASWPMPSDKFRSTGTGRVAWLVDDDTVRPHTPAWYFWIEGNVSQGTLAVHNGTSWTNHVTFDTRLELTFQRTGSSVYANVTTASAIVDVAPFIEHGELVGGYFDLGGGDVRKIVRQTSGTRERNANDSTTRTKRIHLELEGIDGTEATSGTGYIRPPRALLLIKTAGMPTTLKGWRFTPSDSATAEGYWDYKAHLGPVHMVGRMPQWGSRLQIEHRNDTNESPDGRWESTQLAPPRAIWTGGWSDPFWRGYVQANSTSPAARGIMVTDYDEYGTDVSPGNPLGYAEGELPGMLRGLLDELRGSQTPIVWIPVAPRLWMESGVPSFNPYSWPWQGGTMATIQRQAGALYGVIVSDIDIQHHVGTEGIEDAVRVGTLEVRELR